MLKLGTRYTRVPQASGPRAFAPVLGSRDLRNTGWLGLDIVACIVGTLARLLQTLVESNFYYQRDLHVNIAIIQASSLTLFKGASATRRVCFHLPPTIAELAFASAKAVALECTVAKPV